MYLPNRDSEEGIKAVSVQIAWTESEPAPIIVPRHNGQFAPVPSGLCKRDHLLAPWNLVASDLPARTCLACCRARAAVTYARRKGHPLPDLQILADHIFEELESQVARELTVEDIARFRPGRAPRIDWSRFDTGKPWELYQGEDFESTPALAAANARNWAYRQGRKSRIHVYENYIWLYFIPVSDESA